jgi:hypothetical protein
MEECFFGNIYLCFLPAHTSHGLQPADNGHFNVLKAAYRKEIGRLDSLTDSAPVGKINFLRCLAIARKSVTEKTIKSAWRHTRNWPVNRQKALSHPEIQPDREKRNAEAMAADLELEDDPVDRQFIMAMARENPHQRYKFRRLADEFDTLQARIALLEQENAEMKAREDARAGTKKRRAVPNPNKKFMSIHDILSKGGSVEDLEEERKAEEPIVVEAEEDIYGVSDEEIDEDIPSEIQTRSGRAVKRPTRYGD